MTKKINELKGTEQQYINPFHKIVPQEVRDRMKNVTLEEFDLHVKEVLKQMDAGVARMQQRNKDAGL